MQKKNSKLKSTRGASMILALALCLLCTTVASIIVVNATSGASRNVDRTSQQRGYLAVSSAANLLAEELEGVGTVVANQSTAIYPCKDYMTRGEIEYGGSVISGYMLPDGIFNEYGALTPLIQDPHHTSPVTTVVDGSGVFGALAELLVKATEYIYQMDAAYTEEFTIAPVVADERLPEVKGVFKMDTDYNVRIELTTDISAYTITVVMTKAAVVSREDNVGQETHNHTVYYRKLQWNGSYGDGVGTLICTGDVKAITQTISWNPPTIVKGGTME